MRWLALVFGHSAEEPARCALVWGGFSWGALKALVNAWVRTRFARFIAKLFIMLTLILLFDIAMQITYPV